MKEIMRTSHRTAARAKHQYRADPESWTLTLARNAPQPEANATAIMIKLRTAFENLKAGGTDPTYFDRLASAFNVGLVRAESIHPEAVTTMLMGSAALVRCDQRFGVHGHFGFDGPGLQSVADALDLYEGILRLSTPGMMEAALDEAARRMLAAAQEVAHG